MEGVTKTRQEREKPQEGRKEKDREPKKEPEGGKRDVCQKENGKGYKKKKRESSLTRGGELTNKEEGKA
jgi:hypothetical protein